MRHESMKGAMSVWENMIEEASDVSVRSLTFVEVLPSRNTKHLIPAVARVYARLRQLGLPVFRLHTDRARELTSAPMRRWTLDRGIITTFTSGSSFKCNGRVEAEVGIIKRMIRTLVSSGSCTLTQWPLAARHLGERRLRCQLTEVGWPTGKLLRFGAKVFALK